VGNLALTNGAEITAGTGGPGNAGMITVKATGDVTLTGTNTAGSFATGIYARTSGSSNAGNILVEAKNVTLTDGAQISSSTGFAGRPVSGNAGTVTVKA